MNDAQVKKICDKLEALQESMSEEELADGICVKCGHAYDLREGDSPHPTGFCDPCLIVHLEQQLSDAKAYIDRLEGGLKLRTDAHANSYFDLDELKKEKDSIKSKLADAEKAALNAVTVWNQQCGRVFERMGSDNPRAISIDEAIDALKQTIGQKE